METLNFFLSFFSLMSRMKFLFFFCPTETGVRVGRASERDLNWHLRVGFLETTLQSTSFENKKKRETKKLCFSFVFFFIYLFIFLNLLFIFVILPLVASPFGYFWYFSRLFGRVSQCDDLDWYPHLQMAIRINNIWWSVMNFFVFQLSYVVLPSIDNIFWNVINYKTRLERAGLWDADFREPLVIFVLKKQTKQKQLTNE